MRYSDFKLVEANLGSPTDDKYLAGVNELLKDPNHRFALGPKGDKGFFIPLPGQQVSSRKDVIRGYSITNPDAKISDAYIQKLQTLDNASLQSEIKNISPAVLLLLINNNVPKLSNVAELELKNKVSQVLVSTLYKSNEIKLASGGKVDDKEKYPIKPGVIFADEKFPAMRVFDEVIQNNILQETEIGTYIIQMAKEIRDGRFPSLKTVPKQFHTAIRDYAGEYLGVLALIKGIANFPTRDKWLEHLGVTDLNDITIYFPRKSNNQLGDSEGYFQNKETGNIILISSKGGAKGAPPSVTGLKIPENLKTDEYALEVDVIETLQNLPAFEGPFIALNKLYQAKPDAIDPVFAATLPLSDQDIQLIKEFSDSALYNKRNVADLPQKFRTIVGKGPDAELKATPGGILHYTYSRELLEAINQRNALPNFEPMAREILQKNFIQIFARPKLGELTFDVLWPNKEMATGKIELYNKSSSTGIKGKLSFSVT